MAREKLGEILIRAGLLDDVGLQRALNEQQRWGGPLGRYLVDLGLISEETLVRALSTQLKIPAVALDPPKLNISVGKLVPREICERNNLVCFRADSQKKFLDIALSDPSNLDAIDEVRVATRCNVRPHIATASAIDQSIAQVFYGGVSVGGELDLLPSSAMHREDAGKAAPPGGPRSAASPAPAAPPRASAAPNAASPPPRARPGLDLPEISLPPPEAESFHITLDVPALDKAALAANTHGGAEDRLAMVEALVARNSELLEQLLELLIQRGHLSREEMTRLISGR